VKYRLKQKEIEAIQFTGHNTGDIMSFVWKSATMRKMEDGIVVGILIHTVNLGLCFLESGDYVVRHKNGTFDIYYPVFMINYEPITETADITNTPIAKLVVQTQNLVTEYNSLPTGERNGIRGNNLRKRIHESMKVLHKSLELK
jgi:hypothetical protein